MGTVKVIEIIDGKPVVTEEVYINLNPEDYVAVENVELYPSDELQQESARLQLSRFIGY